MKQVKKPSVIPIYGVGAVILLYNLLFPMIHLWQLALCLAAAAGAYLALRKICPPQIVYVEEEKPNTGNAALDAAILQGRETIAALRKLNEEIPDAAVSAQLQRIEDLTKEIFRQVEEEQDKLTKIRQTMNYYLPTTLKLVRKYRELQNQQSLPNVRTMLCEIASMLGTVAEALQRQLDGLYEHDVIDITADIKVMEQMLKSQGLTGDADFEPIHERK